MAEIQWPSITDEEIKEKYPLHWCVWYDNTEKLEELLTSKLHNQEVTDPHERTPLLLAISMGFTESVKTLLTHSCDASAQDKQGWNATQEAVGSGNPDLLSMIIKHREYQNLTQKCGGMTDILESLEEADDFYVEMKWEFSSWIPLVSRVCPSDSYKIYKSGACVRVDTTLKGFDQMNWQRGNQSFIFKGGARSSDFYEVDHEKKCYWKESVKVRDESLTLESLHPPVSVVSSRLRSPNVTICLDHDKISFTRQKSGFPWFGHDKTETINGFESKVFTVAGVEMVTRTRMEHMTHEDVVRLEDEKKQNESQVPAIFSFLKQDEKEEEINMAEVVDDSSTNPFGLTIEQYFNPKLNAGKDVGRLRRMSSKSQKFSATVALSDTFPLSLHDQVLPVINLMANSNSHFAKLRDFITLQLPAGFPVKIEIPLFHVLNARVTFHNINGAEECPDGIVILEEDPTLKPPQTSTYDLEPGNGATGGGGEVDETPSKTCCIIDKSIFEVHEDYRDLGTDVNMYRSDSVSYRDEEDELLQLAIQQSLVETNSSQGMLGGNPEDDELQKAIRESLIAEGIPAADLPPPQASIISSQEMTEEEQLMMALQLSEMETENTTDVSRQEEEEFQRVLALSLQEK